MYNIESTLCYNITNESIMQRYLVLLVIRMMYDAQIKRYKLSYRSSNLEISSLSGARFSYNKIK